MKVAMIGLGQMGLPIVGRLATSFDVVAFDISEERRTLAACLPRTVVTPHLKALAGSSVVVLSLPNPAVSRQVLSQLAPALHEGTIVIETSTVLPDDVREWGRTLEPHGVAVVDAAVLSGVGQMELGNATLLVGGDGADVDKVDGVLTTIGGGGVTRFGQLGAGMAAKVVNNGVAHAVMVVLVEAFAMANAEGVSLHQIADMLSREDGGLQRPLKHRVMERIATGRLDGGMSLEAARKDSTLALSMAQRAGVPLFVTQAAQTVYDIASVLGMGRQDYAAIAQLWTGWTGKDLTFGDEE